MDEQEQAVEEKPKPKPKPKMIPVKVIKAKGESALVEWRNDDGLQRGFVPLGQIKDRMVSETALKRAIPYGLPWERIIEVTATPESIAQDLRRRGVWTFEDLSMPGARKANLAFGWGEFMKRAKKEARK